MRPLLSVLLDPLATAELDALLEHPALLGRWPDGFTTDDVLAELTALGRVAVEVPEGDEPYVCGLEPRDGAGGSIAGRGRTLTAAALRCLIQVERELRAAFDDVIERFGDLLGER